MHVEETPAGIGESHDQSQAVTSEQDEEWYTQQLPLLTEADWAKNCAMQEFARSNPA